MGADDSPRRGAEPEEGGRPFLTEAFKADPELRRDVATAFQLCTSPRRYAGWEPPQRTRLIYDEQGRLVETITTREPEWDEIDRALIDVLQNWRADLHTCGRPLSESLYDPDSDEPDPDYQVAVETCRACMALDKFHADHAKDPSDEALRKAGRNPDSFREHRVFPLAELDPVTQEAILASRRARRTGRPKSTTAEG